jgi:osmotically-inducible protein OsmY
MPKKLDGLQISDQSQNEDLQRLIAQRLGHCGHPGLRGVSVVVDDQRITLFGTVPSYYMKQMAQETARQACSSRKVYNDLDVVPAGN